MTNWFKARFGRMRVSTIVLIVAFVGLFWVNQTVEPQRGPTPVPAVVPPGFVPDPNYTWVPRTNVRRTTEPSYTTTTAPTTTTTTTTSPTETTTTSPTPTTTVLDPDGVGPRTPTTETTAPETTTEAPPLMPQQPQLLPQGATTPPS
ncbi:hypothetical protein [Mycolicibacterium celeriflavum]|uniref:Uncharacterized protein n=1 Tax=Mycolicibacterium celeriflavum TaxID=1249101 RepID=A0A1X0BL49_MYCCF|nr:hypothetical protein [Mycolicibacterium celeriflavum]MCV7240454.1 hypothetical protein [Mycolicibacterium celeriflavum]ORA43394.1 hypothetical protein BST21_21795 [Mycolicibacterium celeriflavum]BBY43598.1 hypothetical protein MCEL_18930 [Mycolicibacterium celeriflavum]